MDVKTAFLNGSLEEDVYMDQLEGFFIKGKEYLACKLKKSIYGLKQASRQWYLKFNDTITSFGFKENTIDRCIYLKVNGSKFIFLICTSMIFFLLVVILAYYMKPSSFSLRNLK